MALLDKISISFVLTFSLRVASVGLQFAMILSVVRVLGETQAGLYLSGFGLFMMIAVAGRFGTENALVRVIGKTKLLKESANSAVACYSASTLAVVFAMTLVVLVIVALCLRLVESVYPTMVGGQFRSLIFLFCIAAVAYNLVVTLAQGFLGGGKQLASIFYLNVLWPTAFICSLYVLKPHDASHAVTLFTVIVFVTLFVASVHWAVTYGFRFSSALVRAREVLAISKHLFLAEIMVQFANWAPIFVIALLIGMQEVTEYTVASRLAMLLMIGTQAINLYYSPKLARLDPSVQRVELVRMYANATRAIWLLSLPLALLMLSAPENFSRLFGLSSDSVTSATRILVVGQLAVLAVGVAPMVLIMQGCESDYRKAIQIHALTTAVLSFIFGHFFGVLGVAFGVAIAGLAMSASMFISVRRGFGLSLPTGFLRPRSELK